MALILGDSSKPSTTAEAWAGATWNNHGHVLTMPGGGPWLVTRIGVWCAGYGANATGRVVLWAGGDGAILAQSGNFTVIQRTFAAGNSDLYEADLTAPYQVAGGESVIVGVSRVVADGVFFGRRASGSHRDKTGAFPDSMAGNTTDGGGAMGAYLYYDAANSAPNAPTLNDPTGGELVASQTPTLNFTPSDPDGDTHTAYTYQVDNNSDFSSPVESTEVTGSFPNGVAINRVVTSTLSRGTTYYWRAKTKDASGYGPYSAGASFKVAVLPTATVTAPVNAQTAELYFTAGSAGDPKIKARWSYSCTDGHAQSQIVIKIYADSAGSPGALLNTDTYNGTATSFDTTYAVVENTKYHVSVTPKCSLQVQGVESSKKICRTRWGRASYFFDSGSTPVTLSSAANTTVGANQAVVLEYTATASTAEPTTWYASVSSAGLNRYFWHRATMFAWGSATPSSPKVNSVTWTYSANGLTLDFWTVATGGSVDTGTYVYGTQSLKHATNGAAQKSYVTIPVTANTDIVMQGRIKTLGQPNAELRIEDPEGTVLASVVASSGTDWTRLATAVINTGSATSLRAVCYTNAAGGASAWFDAIKVEASTVVTPWTPGFVASAVSLDAGGVQINGTAGGVFRLRGATGGTRDIVELGTNGLLLGGSTGPVNLYSPSADLLEVDDDFKVLGGDVYLSTDARISRNVAKGLRLSDNAAATLNYLDFMGAKVKWGGTSFPGSPASDDLFYRTDRDLLYFYDGTRWLTTHLYDIPLGINAVTQAVTDTQGGVQRIMVPHAGVYDLWLENFQAAFYVTGGTALGASHKWVVTFNKQPAGTVVATVNIDSGASDTYRTSGQIAINALVGTTNFLFDTFATKTGTPGTLIFVPTITYRMVG